MAARQLKQSRESSFIERAEKCLRHLCTVLNVWEEAATSACEQVAFINKF